MKAEVLRSRCWQDCIPSGSSRGEPSSPCLSWLLESACILWCKAPSFIFKASNVASSNLYPCPSSFPFIRKWKYNPPLWDCIGPTWITQDNLQLIKAVWWATLISSVTLIPVITSHIYKFQELGHRHFKRLLFCLLQTLKSVCH